MEPFDLVLCKYLFKSGFGSKDIFLEVVALDSKAEVITAFFPIDASHIKIELFFLLKAHLFPNLVAKLNLVDLLPVTKAVH